MTITVFECQVCNSTMALLAVRLTELSYVTSCNKARMIYIQTSANNTNSTQQTKSYPS